MKYLNVNEVSHSAPHARRCPRAQRVIYKCLHVSDKQLLHINTITMLSNTKAFGVVGNT